MIRIYEQVPQVYSNVSRDFQYISWLFDIVLNSVKHNVDSLYSLPNNRTDPRLVELLALTLGFKVKRNYDQDQLEALVSIIPSVLKNKGTKKALTIAAEAIIRASGSKGRFEYKEVNNNVLEVVLPKELVDITLFIDILPYILPAGLTCKITRKTEVLHNNRTEVGLTDTANVNWYEDLSIDEKNKVEEKDKDKDKVLSGFGVRLPKDSENIEFNTPLQNNDGTLTTGLLNNTVIPALDTVIDISKKTKEGEDQ